jgi:histone acetyltransferase (RNA polymerase elongator complex component)
MAALAYQTYEIVEQQISTIIDLKWMDEDSKLILLGGIMINIDDDAPDLFIPLNFQSYSKDGSVNDMLEQAFKSNKKDLPVVDVMNIFEKPVSVPDSGKAELTSQ